MDLLHLLATKQKQWQRSLIIMSVLLIIISCAYLMMGSLFISPFSTISTLESRLLLELRLPRLLAAMVIGAALAVSGASLQVLLGNVLAEPGVLGISGGASLAMVIALFFLPLVPDPQILMFASILGAMCFTFLLVSLAKVMRLSTAKLLLVGVALGILSSAGVTWAFYFSDNLSLRTLMYWLMGSLSGIGWQQHILSLLMLPVIIWLCLQGKVLDKLMMGESHATQLGVNVSRFRWRLIIAVSVLVGCSVALGGIISFVGLVVPHLLRLALGTQNRYLLPMCALGGAALLVFSDLLARTVLTSAELPLGVMTTTIGAPIFIWMLLKNQDVT